jgi:5,10-methylene-tetrahydrofolate dehydrogenase/methenyl tetrahydrofolate cyclohydrolase
MIMMPEVRSSPTVYSDLLPERPLVVEALRTDALVLEAAEEQAALIAGYTGQTAPTRTQTRAARRIIGSREWPTQSVRAYSPNNEDTLSPWDRIAEATEGVDLAEITDEHWQAILTEAGYDPVVEAENRLRPPCLAVFISSAEDDQISYFLQILMHGTAIGAEVKAFGPKKVSEHAKLQTALKRIGLTAQDIFVENPLLDAHDDEIAAAQSCIDNDDLSLLDGDGEELFTYLARHDIDLAAYGELDEKLEATIDIIDLYQNAGLERTGVPKDLPRLQHRGERLLWQRRELLREAHRRRLDKAKARFTVRSAAIVASFNDNPDIDGALVLLPAPDVVRGALGAKKDLDGVNPNNHKESITARSAIEIAERQLGPLGATPPEEIFVSGGDGLVGSEIVRILAAQGIPVPTQAILKGREAILDYERQLGDGAYSLGFTAARGGEHFDLSRVKAGDHGLFVVDAGRNVIKGTGDAFHQATPQIGGLGLWTTKNLFGELIKNWQPKPRGGAVWHALGSAIKRYASDIFASAAHLDRSIVTDPAYRGSRR